MCKDNKRVTWDTTKKGNIPVSLLNKTVHELGCDEVGIYFKRCGSLVQVTDIDYRTGTKPKPLWDIQLPLPHKHRPFRGMPFLHPCLQLWVRAIITATAYETTPPLRHIFNFVTLIRWEVEIIEAMGLGSRYSWGGWNHKVVISSRIRSRAGAGVPGGYLQGVMKTEWFSDYITGISIHLTQLDIYKYLLWFNVLSASHITGGVIDQSAL